MSTSLNQLYVFAMFLLTGGIIGILFDIFRILRKSFKTSDFITYIEDIIFWILSGIILIYSIFVFNNGELRIYIFIGLLLGLSIYLLLLSKYFIKINVAIVLAIKSFITSILHIFIFPFRLLRKMLFKPISFIFINLRKKTKSIIINVSKKIKNVFKQSKKQKKADT